MYVTAQVDSLQSLLKNSEPAVCGMDVVKLQGSCVHALHRITLKFRSYRRKSTSSHSLYSSFVPFSLTPNKPLLFFNRVSFYHPSPALNHCHFQTKWTIAPLENHRWELDLKPINNMLSTMYIEIPCGQICWFFSCTSSLVCLKNYFRSLQQWMMWLYRLHQPCWAWSHLHADHFRAGGRFRSGSCVFMHNLGYNHNATGAVGL